MRYRDNMEVLVNREAHWLAYCAAVWEVNWSRNKFVFNREEGSMPNCSDIPHQETLMESLGLDTRKTPSRAYQWALMIRTYCKTNHISNKDMRDYMEMQNVNMALINEWRAVLPQQFHPPEDY